MKEISIWPPRPLLGIKQLPSWRKVPSGPHNHCSASNNYPREGKFNLDPTTIARHQTVTIMKESSIWTPQPLLGIKQLPSWRKVPSGRHNHCSASNNYPREGRFHLDPTTTARHQTTTLLKESSLWTPRPLLGIKQLPSWRKVPSGPHNL